MRRWILVTIALLLAVTGAVVTTSAAPADDGVERRKKPVLTPSPALPLQGTALTLRTKLPTKFKRKAQLQQRGGTSWVTVARRKTKRNGKVAFEIVAAGDATYRVLAKKTKHRGKKYKKVVTKPHTAPVTLRAELVSVTPAGVSPGAESGSVDLSADGRYVVFASDATTLVPGVTGYVPEQSNVFLRDRSTGVTTLVSHATAGPTVAGNSTSSWPRISADGRHVVFVSYADDLVAGDDEGHQDVFRWDRTTGNIIRISEAGAGGDTDGSSHDPSISADGDVIAFTTEATNIDSDDDNGLFDVYAWDADTGESDRVSVDVLGGDSNGPSHSGIVSANGSYVSFASQAGDLVFNDTNDVRDVFRRDLAGATTAIVSRGVSAAGDGATAASGAAISSDGRYVAFSSTADNLVPGGSPDNGKLNVFLRDLVAQSTVLVSRDPSGGPTSDHSLSPGWVSDDGRYVTYPSLAADLVPGDTNGFADAFLWDRTTDASSIIVRSSQSGPVNGNVYEPVVTPDLQWVGFYSTATNLVPGDTGPTSDAYVWRLQ
jgi:Tol biopolymer transport system component